MNGLVMHMPGLSLFSSMLITDIRLALCSRCSLVVLCVFSFAIALAPYIASAASIPASCSSSTVSNTTMWCDFGPAIAIGHSCGFIANNQCVCYEPSGLENICYSCKREEEISSCTTEYTCPMGYRLNGDVCESSSATPATVAHNCPSNILEGDNVWCDFQPAIDIGHSCGYISDGHCVCTQPDGNPNVCYTCTHTEETPSALCESKSCPTGYILN